jgi:hypothetical protein
VATVRACFRRNSNQVQDWGSYSGKTVIKWSRMLRIVSPPILARYTVTATLLLVRFLAFPLPLHLTSSATHKAAHRNTNAVPFPHELQGFFSSSELLSLFLCSSIATSYLTRFFNGRPPYAFCLITPEPRAKHLRPMFSFSESYNATADRDTAVCIYPMSGQYEVL